MAKQSNNPNSNTILVADTAAKALNKLAQKPDCHISAALNKIAGSQGHGIGRQVTSHLRAVEGINAGPNTKVLLVNVVEGAPPIIVGVMEKGALVRMERNKGQMEKLRAQSNELAVVQKPVDTGKGKEIKLPPKVQMMAPRMRVG